MPSVDEDIVLYGPRGEVVSRPSRGGREGVVTRAYSSYLSSLSQLTTRASLRARNPLTNHVWVYVGATAIARAIQQAELAVFVETIDATRAREARAKALGRRHELGRFDRRSFIARYASLRCRRFGCVPKGVERDPDHPASLLFMRPNALMSGRDLVAATAQWLSVRGEAFWLPLDASGQPIEAFRIEQVDSIWIVHPDSVEEICTGGAFRGWRLSLGRRDSVGTARQTMEVTPEQLVVFKFYNPENPLRGLSPVSAAAMGIDIDMAAAEWNRSTIMNNAEPGGVLTHDEDLDPKEVSEQERAWLQRHSGSRNVNKVTTLTGGWKWQPLSLKPRDMEFIKQKMLTKEEVLACIGVPPGAVGEKQQNYATALVQKKDLWDNPVFTIVRLIEDVLDATMFWEQDDRVSGLFDLSGVEALKAGLDEKVATAIRMSGSELHTPPRIAYEIVGLDVPGYEGDDVALVSPMLAPAPDVLSGELSTAPGPGPGLGEARLRAAAAASRERRRRQRVWRSYERALHAPSERAHKIRWRQWVEAERKTTLARFDSATRSMKAAVNADAVVQALSEMQSRIRGGFGPMYEQLMLSSYQFVGNELGGVLVFELDDPALRAYLEQAKRVIGMHAPRTLRASLVESLTSGIASGETIQELRRRILDVYKGAASPAKTLAIARTESTTFLNGAREVMLGAAGVEKFVWVTASDELVREDHQVFGSHKPVETGFNYMELVGGGGTLRYPGDPAAPAGQRVNCRCLRIAVG